MFGYFIVDNSLTRMHFRFPNTLFFNVAFCEQNVSSYLVRKVLSPLTGRPRARCEKTLDLVDHASPRIR